MVVIASVYHSQAVVLFREDGSYPLNAEPA